VSDFIRSENVRRIYEYWLTKAASDRMPSRQDIKLPELRDLAPQIFIVDVLTGPLQFRFRLFGSHLVELAGQDLTGRILSEDAGNSRANQVYADYKSVVETCQPRFDQRVQVEWLGRRYDSYERIIMPLSQDGQTVTMLLVALDVRERV
jgi:hypothetical protein